MPCAAAARVWATTEPLVKCLYDEGFNEGGNVVKVEVCQGAVPGSAKFSYPKCVIL